MAKSPSKKEQENTRHQVWVQLAVAIALIIGFGIGLIFSYPANSVGLFDAGVGLLRSWYNPNVEFTDAMTEDQLNELIKAIDASDPALAVGKPHFEVNSSNELEMWVPLRPAFTVEPGIEVKLLVDDPTYDYNWDEVVIGAHWMKFAISDDARTVNMQLREFNTETEDYRFSNNVEIIVPDFNTALNMWENQDPP